MNASRCCSAHAGGMAGSFFAISISNRRFGDLEVRHGPAWAQLCLPPPFWQA